MSKIKKHPQKSKDEETKSLLDYTPEEIEAIDQRQTRNRGFEDDGEEDIENNFGEGYDYE